ncbi:hypothetical protein HDU98_005680 [Podochytrium sp. JEL0797]|nr:hypothetical protein HDU98_005680 [Podochytrium sp. JEL0797]
MYHRATRCVQAQRHYGNPAMKSPLPWKHKASPYSLLGVSKNATSKEIKQKYYELSFSHHPDRTLNKSPAAKEETLQSYMAIQDAHELLRHDQYRREYDLMGDCGYAGPMINKSGEEGRYAYPSQGWTVQDAGVQPPGEMKIFRPWMYGTGLLLVTMFFMARAVTHRKVEIQEQAWRDWHEAKRGEDIVFERIDRRRHD